MAVLHLFPRVRDRACYVVSKQEVRGRSVNRSNENEVRRYTHALLPSQSGYYGLSDKVFCFLVGLVLWDVLSKRVSNILGD